MNLVTEIQNLIAERDALVAQVERLVKYQDDLTDKLYEYQLVTRRYKINMKEYTHD